MSAGHSLCRAEIGWNHEPLVPDTGMEAFLFVCAWHKNVINKENSRKMWIEQLEKRLESGLSMIRHIWIEHMDMTEMDIERESTDVLVETDDGAMWSASFVTIPYLQRQMQMSREVAHDIANMPPVRFVAIETPHVIVDRLDQDTIEDTIDNMMTLGVFESVFVLQRAEEAAETTENEFTVMQASVEHVSVQITASESTPGQD